jgi:hypothetical protein
MARPSSGPEEAVAAATEPDERGLIAGPWVEIVGMPRAPGSWWAPSEGQEVARVPVIITGANPHVEFQPDFTGQISLEGNWDLIESLDRMGATVAQILSDIEPWL